MSSPRIVTCSRTSPGARPNESRISAGMMSTERRLPGLAWRSPSMPRSASAFTRSFGVSGTRFAVLTNNATMVGIELSFSKRSVPWPLRRLSHGVRRLRIHGRRETRQHHGDVIVSAALARQRDQRLTGRREILAAGEARQLLVAHQTMQTVAAEQQRVLTAEPARERTLIHLDSLPHADAARE